MPEFKELSLEERSRFSHILSSGIHEPVPLLGLLQQKEGLSSLYSFLYLDGSFESVRPFVLDISSKTPTIQDRVSPSYPFYLGSGNKYLQLTVPLEVVENNRGVIWTFPRSLRRGEKPYFWLDFHNPDDPIEEAKPFSDCLLHPDQQTKTDFRRWHGIEEELLADFISSNNNICFDDLVPAELLVEQKSQLASYRLGGRSGLSLSLYENSLINDGDRLRLLPQQDEQGIYTWIDIRKIVEGQSEMKLSPVASYRILQESKKLYRVGWFGAERQLFIDYILGLRGIKFENLRPIITAAQKGYAQIVQSRRIFDIQANLYFPSHVLSQGEEVIVIPQQDEQKLYQWVEMYKTNPHTHQIMGECITSGRITDKGINQMDWLGVERELLRDYTGGKVGFNNLKTVSLRIGVGRDLIHLWREDEKRIYLVLSKSFDLEQGDDLNFTPEKEGKDGATFLLVKEGTTLARYRFDGTRKQFICIDNFTVNKEINLQYDQELDLFVDNESKNWITKERAVKKFRASFETLEKLFIGVTMVRYKWSGSDRMMLLYSESELLEKAKEHNLTSLDQWVKTSLDYFPNSEVWVFQDSEGDWLTKVSLQKILGLTNRDAVINCEQVKSKQVRASSGRQVKVFCLNDVVNLQSIQEYISLPRVDKTSGVYIDEKGEWAATHLIARKYSISPTILKKMELFEKVPKILGISGGHRTFLYNLDELIKLPEFQDCLVRREQRSKSQKSTQSRERIKWLEISQEQRIALIEEEARRFFETNGKLDQKSLNIHYSWLAAAISKFYPGKLIGLQEKLGISKNSNKSQEIQRDTTEADNYLRDLVFGEG